VEPTRILGPYALLSPLAQGGMGSVYLAVRLDQEPPRSLLLVKTLKAGLADANDYTARFADEMRVAVQLRHPNLCAVFEGGNEAGEFFLAMELIEGITFKRLLALLNTQGQRVTATQAVALAVAMLRGLHGAHVARDDNGRPLGVVHRDVSPHNVMVDVRGRVKIIDFGLATSVLKETFTESAVVLGKSAYMAPEQARGENATVAADQYAAGIVLYELLTQERFYGELSSRQIWSVAGAGNHQPRLWSEVPIHLQGVLARALFPDPRRRFGSCAAFADALVAAEPSSSAPDVLPAVGGLVRSLDPDELGAIDAARTRLAEVEGVTGGMRPAPRPEITEAVRRSPGGSPGSPRSPDDTAATQLARRSSGAGAGELAGDAAATRRLIWSIAALAGIACLTAVGVAVFVATRPPPAAPAPVVVVQPAPPSSVVPPAVSPLPVAASSGPAGPSALDIDFHRRIEAVRRLWATKKNRRFCGILKPRVEKLLALPVTVSSTEDQRTILDSVESTLQTCQ
jgi:serine/threonine-protein kinase